jgi:hypothetical protein
MALIFTDVGVAAADTFALLRLCQLVVACMRQKTAQYVQDNAHHVQKSGLTLQDELLIASGVKLRGAVSALLRSSLYPSSALSRSLPLAHSLMCATL